MDMNDVQLSIEELLGEDQKLTFLIGAGCSVDKPSNQPDGRAMMEAMIQFACDEAEIKHISGLEDLRFEALVEIETDHLELHAENLK